MKSLGALVVVLSGAVGCNSRSENHAAPAGPAAATAPAPATPSAPAPAPAPAAATAPGPATAPVLPPLGPTVLELGELTIHEKGGRDQTETPALRLHADGKIERLVEWDVGPDAIRADGLVICDGSIGGKIGGADGLPHPEAPQLAEDWKLGSWKLRGKGNKLTLIQADGGRMTIAPDGRLDLAEGDEETGKPGKPEPWGRVEGASTDGLRRTALWVIGLHIGDEQPICWDTEPR